MLISKKKTKKSTGLKHLNYSKNNFINYSIDIDDVSKNIEECNPNKNRKTLIVFYNMIADNLSNKKLIPIVAELFSREKTLNIYTVFIT